MNSDLAMVLIVLGAIAVVLVIYATVNMLIKRHPLYEQVKAVTSRLLLKSTAYRLKWKSWGISTRQNEFKVVPQKERDKAEKLRQEIEPKLKRQLKPWRRVRAMLYHARTGFLGDKAKRLKVVGPIDWPFWLFWQTVYGLYALLNWAPYSVVLSLPSHTMHRLKRRNEYLQGLERELDTAIRAIERLAKGSRFLTKEREKELKEQVKAKRRAEEIAQKRLVFEEIRHRLVEAMKFHLTAPAEEILRGSSLLNLDEARNKWRAELEMFESPTPDEGVDNRILLCGNFLSIFEPVSLVEGGPALSEIQRYAERIAESEKLIVAAEEAFRERLDFLAIETASPAEPTSLAKARNLLAEASGYWYLYFELQKLADLANAADKQTRQAARDFEDLQRWEDIILAFDRRRADIKENEDALLAYGVEIPQTPDWKAALETLENEVPQAWASYKWPKLNELNTTIDDAFTTRAQEVNRRLEAEHNKRVGKGQAIPQGGRRQPQAVSPLPESPAPSNGGSARNHDAGRLSIRYAPDPDHMEPLFWVRSRSTATGIVLQVTQSLAVDGTYIIVNPENLDESLVWARSTAGKFLQVAQSLAKSSLYKTVSPTDPNLLKYLQAQPGK